MSDTQVYEPWIGDLLGTVAHFCEVVVLKSPGAPGIFCKVALLQSLLREGPTYRRQVHARLWPWQEPHNPTGRGSQPYLTQSINKGV